MAKSVEKMSLEELKAHQKEVEAAIVSFAKKQRAEAMAEMRAVGKKYGMTPEELFGGKTAPATKTKGVAKYVNPDDATQTWTGRGRQPNWVKAAMASGKSLSDMEI